MYIIYDTTSGEILLATDSTSLRDANVGAGQAWLESDADVTNSKVVNGAVVLDTARTNEALANSIRTERDTLLRIADGRSLKYTEQILLVGTTPDLSNEQYQRLLQYKQDLRDVPEQSGFPNNVTWPTWPL